MIWLIDYFYIQKSNTKKRKIDFFFNKISDFIAYTIQLLNPDVIVLGGVVSEANQFVLTPIQQSINQYCLEQISRNTKIVISENWEESGLLGVTAMLFQKLFSNMYK